MPNISIFQQKLQSKVSVKLEYPLERQIERHIDQIKEKGYLQYLNDLKKQGSGRLSTYTKEEEQTIVQFMDENRDQDNSKIARNFPINFKGVDRKTISRISIKYGYQQQVAVKTFSLKEQQRVQRLKWAKQYRKWPFYKWKNVWTSDESKQYPQICKYTICE